MGLNACHAWDRADNIANFRKPFHIRRRDQDKGVNRAGEAVTGGDFGNCGDRFRDIRAIVIGRQFEHQPRLQRVAAFARSDRIAGDNAVALKPAHALYRCASRQAGDAGESFHGNAGVIFQRRDQALVDGVDLTVRTLQFDGSIRKKCRLRPPPAIRML